MILRIRFVWKMCSRSLIDRLNWILRLLRKDLIITMERRLVKHWCMYGERVLLREPVQGQQPEVMRVWADVLCRLLSIQEVVIKAWRCRFRLLCLQMNGKYLMRSFAVLLLSAIWLRSIRNIILEVFRRTVVQSVLPVAPVQVLPICMVEPINRFPWQSSIHLEISEESFAMERNHPVQRR